MSMPGVWNGIEVLDLSWGIAGPIASMLLADNGARVTKIEPPGGDPFRVLSGYRVWNRGKRSAVLDLKVGDDRDRLRALAARADVLIESFSPGTTDRLGIDYPTLSADNPRLVYCSITGYGTEGPDVERPAIDALVAARTGLQWESRGVLGGTIARLSGTPPILAGLDVPVERWEGPPREGPMFSGVPWPSMGAAHLAHLNISAAMRAREITGRGQHVETSLMLGAFASGSFAWMRADRADTPGYQSWVQDPRAPKGYFLCADGRWVHQWTPMPGLLAAAAGSELAVTEEVKSHINDGRLRVAAEGLPTLQAGLDDFARKFARFTSAAWEGAAAEAGVSVQTVRAPEEALRDELLMADGAVTEVDDVTVGPVRQVGRLYRFSKCSWDVPLPAPSLGEHTAAVRAEADSGPRDGPPSPPEGTTAPLRHPLEGTRIIDFSLAVAGPFGAQLLAELGADVIKVNSISRPNLPGHMHAMCERSKRSIAIDLKSAVGKAIFLRLVETADVVHTNMRQAAVDRLGLSYDALRRANPSVIYCHTRGHEDGPRKNLVGHDQSSAAIAGVSWLEGGMDGGGRPHWPSISIGDTGNGFLWASAVVQALYHRDRTGEGQMVDTAIVNAHLLNASMAWTNRDGSVTGARPRLDGMATGWNALYRLYETSDGWLCIAVLSEDHWQGLCKVVDEMTSPGPGTTPGLASDRRFQSREGRADHDTDLAAVLGRAFGRQPVEHLQRSLEEAGVPSEISSPDYVLSFFEDSRNATNGRLVSYEDPMAGAATAFGLLADLSDTPGRFQGPPLVVGGQTRDILVELGFDDREISRLCDEAVIMEAGIKAESGP
jgi:crotonobetainyl-CoA:carnitine CoA-transferase CaiB-like acyl-CoA transferase